MTDLVTTAPNHAPGEDLKSATTMFENAGATWVVPSGETLVANRWNNLSAYSLNVSAIENGNFGARPAQTSNLDLPFGPGEAVVGASIVMSDTERTVTLPASANDLPILLGWNTMASDTLAIGPPSSFTADWNTTEIYRVTTDSNSITNLVDERPLGQDNARSVVGSPSDVYVERRTGRPSDPTPYEQIVERTDADHRWERYIGNDRWEMLGWSEIGTTIEDFEESGGSFPSYWEPYSGHAVTSAADLEGGSWGFSTEGRNGTSTAPGPSLPAKPRPGEWFEFLFRVDTSIDQTFNTYIRFGVQPDSDARYEFYLELNPSSDDLVRLDAADTDGSNLGGLTPYDTVFPGGYSPGTIYRCQVYWGDPGETWHVRWLEHATDTIILDQTATTDVNYPAGGIEVRCLNYEFDFSMDRFRRPPLDNPNA